MDLKVIRYFIEIVDAGGGVFQLQTTLFEALWHGDNDQSFDESLQLLLFGGEQSEVEGVISLQYEVTRIDGDGDRVVVSDSITLADGETSIFSFDDDGPQIAQFELTDTAAVVVDESKGWWGSTEGEPGQAPAADEFGHWWDPVVGRTVIGYTQVDGDSLYSLIVDGGSDGENESQRNFAFIIEEGVESGLSATAGGTITLHAFGDDVIGKDSSGDIVFRLSIDADDGEITLWQYEAINHDEDDNDHDALKSLAEDVLKVRVTVYDQDGDPINADVDLGKVIGFEDDGPKINCFELERCVEVVVDESRGILGSLEDEPGQALPFDEFLHSPGPDGVVIGYAKVDGCDLFKLSVDGGSDKEDTSRRSFEFSVFNGTLSGLSATDGGVIKLYNDGDDVVGKDEDNNIVFRLRIDEDDGDITLWQYEAINHGPDGNDHDALKALAEGALKVKVTVYDKDGDSDYAKVDVGKVIGFEDDGPSAGLSIAFVEMII